jgi:hypothetical protein
VAAKPLTHGSLGDIQDPKYSIDLILKIIQNIQSMRQKENLRGKSHVYLEFCS